MLCGESFSGQHPKSFHCLLRSEDRTVSLGSFSGGCSSTAGYVPGNEAQIRRLERRSTIQADHFLKALSVFIPITQVRSEEQTLASLSASVSGVLDSGFPLLLPPEGRVTASIPPLGAGQETLRRSRL